MNLTTLIEKPTWMASAACRGMDVNLFFPEVGRTTVSATAKAVCAACPVAAECLAYAVNLGEHHGIWGGVAEKQRRKIRSRAFARVADRCGTTAGYMAHYRHGTAICEPCRLAQRAHEREWRRRAGGGL